jgi:hypothetical protein
LFPKYFTHPLSSALCVVRADRDAWYEVNKNFSQVGADMETIALSLDGSSAPGHKSVMENVNRYKLKFDAPPGSEDKLPPGAKAGDTVQMIIQSTIWWAEGGRVAKEFEYGRLAWKGFTIDEWDRVKQDHVTPRGSAA